MFLFFVEVEKTAKTEMEQLALKFFFSCNYISEVRSKVRSFRFFNKGYEISPIGIVEWLTPYMLPATMTSEGFKFKIIGLNTQSK